VGRAEDPNGNFAAIGDQQFLEWSVRHFRHRC
jgi:hypothetical protein